MFVILSGTPTITPVVTFQRESNQTSLAYQLLESGGQYYAAVRAVFAVGKSPSTNSSLAKLPVSHYFDVCVWGGGGSEYCGAE